MAFANEIRSKFGVHSRTTPGCVVPDNFIPPLFQSRSHPSSRTLNSDRYALSQKVLLSAIVKGSIISIVNAHYDTIPECVLMILTERTFLLGAGLTFLSIQVLCSC